jgi:Domain of unknown function (DUF6531)
MGVTVSGTGQGAATLNFNGSAVDSRNLGMTQQKSDWSDFGSDDYDPLTCTSSGYQAFQNPACYGVIYGGGSTNWGNKPPTPPTPAVVLDTINVTAPRISGTSVVTIDTINVTAARLPGSAVVTNPIVTFPNFPGTVSGGGNGWGGGVIPSDNNCKVSLNGVGVENSSFALDSKLWNDVAEPVVEDAPRALIADNSHPINMGLNPSYDIGANIAVTHSTLFGDPIHTAVGNKTHPQLDYETSSGYKLAFVRVYNSQATDSSALVKVRMGPGWFTNWDRSV